MTRFVHIEVTASPMSGHAELRNLNPGHSCGQSCQITSMLSSALIYSRGQKHQPALLNNCCRDEVRGILLLLHSYIFSHSDGNTGTILAHFVQTVHCEVYSGNYYFSSFSEIFSHLFSSGASLQLADQYCLIEFPSEPSCHGQGLIKE